MLLHEISSRTGRWTTYGLVGKRLLRVYAQPSGATTKRIGKDRSRPIKDDKRRDRMWIVLAKDRISTSLISRHGRMLATAQSGKPRRKNGDPGRRARLGCSLPCRRADFAPRANGAFVHRAIISLHRLTTFRRGRRPAVQQDVARHGDRHERFWYESRGRGAGIWTRRHRADAFRARRRRRGKRRPWTCVSHSELAAGLKSFSADALDLPPPRAVEPARQVVARYLDNAPPAPVWEPWGIIKHSRQSRLAPRVHVSLIDFAMELTLPPYYWRALPFTCRSAQPLCNSAATYARFRFGWGMSCHGSAG